MDKVVMLPEWYVALVSDCKSIITEREFRARWELVEGYHELGERILSENYNFDRQMIYGQEIVTRLSKSLGVSSKKLYLSVQFAKKYPSLEVFDKSISWSQVVNKYLPESSKDIEEPVTACKHCEIHCAA